MRIAAILTLFVSGCLARNLKVPAEDHAVQAQTIADRCEKGSYGDGPCTTDLQEDVDAMAAQALCLRAIANGERCKGNDPPAEDGEEG